MDFGCVLLGKRRYVQFNDKTRREKKNQREKIENKGPQQEEERGKAGRIEESAWAPNRRNEGDRNSAVSELRQTQLTTHYLSARHWPLSPWSHLARAQAGRQDGLTWWSIAVITVVVNCYYQQNGIKKKDEKKENLERTTSGGTDGVRSDCRG